MRAAHGFTVVELLFAILVLAVGVLGTFQVFESSNRAASVSEAQQDEIHRAQREIERLESLPYAQLFLTKAPATSTNQNNPGFYVKAGSCPGVPPSYRWNQTSAVAEYNQLIINGCTYQFEENKTVTEETLNAEEYKTSEKKECKQTPAGIAACGTGVAPETSWQDERANGLSGTVHDYITWVKDENCNPPTGCPTVNDYKRITVEVTNKTSNPAIAPTKPVLVSAIVVDPKALPTTKPQSGNPLESTEVKCTNGLGEQVKCNYGLGKQTGHTWYLTNSPEETGYENAPKSGCMHYTDALKPSTCGGAAEASKCVLATAYTSCPQVDLLNTTEPEAEKEASFSENLESPAFSETTAGRIVTRDPGASSCSVAPSANAAMGEWWATAPLTEPLKLSGNGGLTLNARTLKGAAANVTLCLAVYVENQVVDNTCKAVLGPNGKALLDPLNLLNSSVCASTKERKDSEQLGGVVSFTDEQWPGETTPLSFTFSYMSGTKTAAAGSSLAVRIWFTTTSGDDIIAQYDAKAVPSLVQLNTE